MDLELLNSMLTTDIQKANLLELLERVKAGHEVILEQNGKPIAKIVPIARTPKESRVPGAMKGKIKMMDNFDDPLPPDISKPFGIMQ